MDQREPLAELGRPLDLQSPEVRGFDGSATGDLNVEPVAHDDGDGAMLGRVLVYASIIIVAVAVLAWKRVG